MRNALLALCLATAAACGGNALTETRVSEPTPSAAVDGTPTDRLLRARWSELGVTPAPAAGDAEFLRRVTLDIAGRIPTPGEVVTYFEDASPTKREKLVDLLLASDEYAEHFHRGVFYKN